MCPGKFEAVYFSAIATDTDPALNPDFWFSCGSAHLWNMSEKTPATDWERRIDELMARQIATPDDAERKRLFDQVQQVFAEHHAGRLLRGAAHLRGRIASRVAERDAGCLASATLVVAGHAGGGTMTATSG